MSRINTIPKPGKTVVAAALGECVHVAGVMKFVRIAEEAGWRAVFLGPAVSIPELLEAAVQEKADLVAVSYRLTPETGERLLGEFAEAADELHSQGVRFAFGGTPPVAARAQSLGFFEKIFVGGEPPEFVLAYLKGQPLALQNETDFPQTAIDRIRWKSPYPLLRHHFGLPTMKSTRNGIIQIAEAHAIDVISLGIDQDAQENFFHPERQDPRRKGAGGVPVRSIEEYEELFAASRRGNFPLLRTYSGTDDFLDLAEIYVDSINIAWCAIPLFWFNKMDGRGPWDLAGSILEHQRIMAWYGERNIPVELNEPHHWGMRDAPDVIFAVSAFLAAYNAKHFGVKDYIAQLMFNSPPGLSDAMDLAKMLAVLELVAPLADQDFRIWRQTRTGLLSYPLEMDAARAHLSASIYLQMSIKPHIVHIVGHTEADHAATAEDIIEASNLARRAIDNALAGQPDMRADPLIQERRDRIVAESKITIQAIHDLAPPGVADPLLDPKNLSRAVQSGIMDAPHLRNNPYALGKINSRIHNGACLAIDHTGKPLNETERIYDLFN
ncbi:MAG: cobalamin B12-binding domain-containing protein [Anaerolineales bacterium]|nr:cobalamin B12-binding domain-containing protein [Anaerolineales bacterium]